MVWSHVIKCWSATQLGEAMISGEAEFYGVVRAAAAGLGIKALYATQASACRCAFGPIARRNADPRLRGLLELTPARHAPGQCRETAFFLPCPRGLCSNSDLGRGSDPLGVNLSNPEAEPSKQAPPGGLPPISQ